MRGQESPIGTQRMSPNGYLYEKTARGWILVHRLVMERKLGRCLTSNELVTFKDGDRTNLDPANLIVRTKGEASLRTRLARIEAQIAALEVLRVELIERLKRREAIANTTVKQDSLI